MAFPTSPTNGQQATVNGITYQYASVGKLWTRVVGSLSTISNGTSNVVITANSNVSIGVGGTSNIAVFSTAGANITGYVTATGNVVAGNIDVKNAGSVRWYDSDNSSYVAFKPPNSVPANLTWTLPQIDGTSGQLLTTDGAATLSWSDGTGAGSSQGGFFNSTLNQFPGSVGNADYGNGETYVGQAQSFDAFGVNLINNYDNMDPSGALLSWDLGSVV